MAAIMVALPRCSYDLECDRMSAAVVLPAERTIALRGRVCVEGKDGFVPQFGVLFEGEDPNKTLVRLSVIDPLTGTEAEVSESPGIEGEAMPSHCDKGFVITLENMRPASDEPLTAFVWLGAAVEEYDRCDVYLEAP